MHIPVLQKEVLQYLDPKPNENFIDATIDGGGHTAAILQKNGPHGKILGIELDTEIYQKLRSRIAEFPISNFQFPNRLILVNDSYTNLKKIIEKYKFGQVSGILFDLGMSSWHLEESGRGFTFMKDEPLDMRYNPENPLTPLEVKDSRRKFQKNKPLTGLTAEKIVNEYSQEEIEKILKEYGEERFAKKIAKRIVQERPIKTTFQLKDIIPGKRTRIHPATRTFQALRIAVNDELNNLKEALPQTIEVLEKGGRIIIISFHSLEDRIVKNFFKEASPDRLKILTKKPIIPSSEEIKINPRCRSAKLRAALKQ